MTMPSLQKLTFAAGLQQQQAGKNTVIHEFI
jgi:hypothetical protein